MKPLSQAADEFWNGVGCTLLVLIFAGVVPSCSYACGLHAGREEARQK